MSGLFVSNDTTMENVIQNLRNELIRSISAIDAWFDKDKSLLSQPVTTTETVAEYLYDLVMTSRNLLDATTQNSNRQAGPVDVQFPHDSLDQTHLRDGKGRVILTAVRAELREQLDRCLIYLEWLQHRQSGSEQQWQKSEVENYGGYQGVYLLLIHLKRHIGALNQVQGQVERH